MKKLLMLLVAAGLTLSAAPVFAAAGKTYQVTGPVVEMNADKIVVQKGKEKWEIARGAAEVPATVKEGSKVMIEYTMTADKITDKDAAKPAKEPKAEKPAKAKK